MSQLKTYYTKRQLASKKQYPEQNSSLQEYYHHRTSILPGASEHDNNVVKEKTKRIVGIVDGRSNFIS